MADGNGQAALPARDGQPPPPPSAIDGGDGIQIGNGGLPPPLAQAQQLPPGPQGQAQAPQPPPQAGADLLARLTDALVRIGER